MTDNWDETRRKTSGMGYRWDNSRGSFIYNHSRVKTRCQCPVPMRILVGTSGGLFIIHERFLPSKFLMNETMRL